MPLLKSILQAAGKGIGGLAFCTFLFLIIIIPSLADFTEHDSLQPIISDLLAESLMGDVDEAELAQIHSSLVYACEKSGNETISMPLDNQIITLNCDEVKATEAKDFGNLVISGLFDDLYFKEYDCEFLECLKQGSEGFMVILSKKGNEFFKNSINILLIGLLISGAILAVSCWKLDSILKSFGTSFIFAGLPGIFLKFFPLPIPTELATAVSPIISSIINQISSRFLIVLIAGIILVIAGFVVGHIVKKKSIKKPKKGPAVAK